MRPSSQISNPRISDVKSALKQFNSISQQSTRQTRQDRGNKAEKERQAKSTEPEKTSPSSQRKETPSVLKPAEAEKKSSKKPIISQANKGRPGKQLIPPRKTLNLDLGEKGDIKIKASTT